MRNVTIGQSLLLKQAVLSTVFVALGVVAWFDVGNVATKAQALVGADAKTAADASAALLDALHAAQTDIILATLVAVIVMLMISMAITHYLIGRPIKAMAGSIEDLAAGHLTVVIDGGGRNDEIGTMARSLIKMRDATSDRQKQAELLGESASEAKQVVRYRMIGDSVERFSKDFLVSVEKFSAMTHKLAKAAQLMIAAAGHASDGSDKATFASTNAASDVSSVATASEQLLDSIEEISRQVVQSTNVVKTAVERAGETNDGMGRLSSAAQKVGDVVSLISRIAAQTNLLALNATIEAARAGDAGRGFAVVAQEVKTLATQTAKATQDITGQIAEMLEATDLSVDAIDKIQKKISEVEHISTIIAAAVHEQGAATQEIARNVRSAAAGTQSMSSHIENVVRSVGETSANASSISNLARELDDIASGMTTMVTNFTKAIKVA